MQLHALSLSLSLSDSGHFMLHTKIEIYSQNWFKCTVDLVEIVCVHRPSALVQQLLALLSTPCFVSWTALTSDHII